MGIRSVKATIAASAVGLLLSGLFQTACDCGSGDSSSFNDAVTDGGVDSSSMLPPPFGEGGPGDGAAAQGALTIAPTAAQVQVSIVNNIVTANKPVQFTAKLNGVQTSVTWSVDRGELGKIDSNGVFTASATAVGDATIYASAAGRQATAKITVSILNKQNGALGGIPDGGVEAGAGGVGGVGGEPLGGPVDPAIVTRLENEASLDPSMKFLYPYDGTVFPRGVLPPIVMWDTTNVATAILVSITQKNFTFEGVYDVSSYAGDATRRVHLDDAAWTAATNGNVGDPLKIVVKIYSPAADKVFGPMAESVVVAPGILKGTVYYNSYDSKLTGRAPAVNRNLGGVIAIQPRSPNPTLAVPSMAGKCHVCHTLSADGSTLFAQDGDADFNNPTAQGDYRNGASYDLRKGGARTAYTTVATDGFTIVNGGNDRKFVWSAPYPDGSFAVTSYGYALETYYGDAARGGPSQGFWRADATGTPTNIGSFVTNAVTPVFAPDGRKLAFNFWAGPGTATVTPGGGSSLAILDFSCGAKAGSVACSGAYAFGNMREVYRAAGATSAGPFVAWPTFLPDGKAVVFHQTAQMLSAPVPPTQTTPQDGRYNNTLTTWEGSKAELYLARDDGKQAGQRLESLNGRSSAGVSYLPTSANHPDDTNLNFMPTVNPVASGGYYWVVFTSRRRYGNLLDTDPWATPGIACPPPDQAIASCDYGSPNKKLWVAAIDINNPTGDPSHPAFYLPGQEFDAGNSRGYWVVDPCKADGASCATGDECCDGFCRAAGDGGALVCQKPTTTMCAQEFEKCTFDNDCCNAPTDTCIGGRCAQRGLH